MTSTNSRIYVAYVFMFAYLTLTITLIIGIYLMAVEQVTVDEWAIALVSSIWGAWTSKSSNILNYYFGDSAQVEANNVTINTALENASTTTSNGMSKRQIINHSLLDVDNLDGGGDDTEINRE